MRIAAHKFACQSAKIRDGDLARFANKLKNYTKHFVNLLICLPSAP